MNELKPCRCGSDSILSATANIENQQYKKHAIWCSKCGNAVVGSSKGLAMLMWNTRVPDPRLKKAVEEISGGIRTYESIDNPTLYQSGYLRGLERSQIILNERFPELKEAE